MNVEHKGKKWGGKDDVRFFQNQRIREFRPFFKVFEKRKKGCKQLLQTPQ